MAFYSYSPWKDAAEFGGGVGRALSQALIQRPEIQAQARMLQQRMNQEQNREPLELELMKAQIANQNFRPEYMGQVLAQRQQALDDRNSNQEAMLGVKKDNLDMQEKFGQSLSELRLAQAKLAEDKAQGGGQSPWANLSAKLNLMQGKEKELATGSDIQPKLPISPESDLKNLILQAKTPEEVQSILELAKLEPNTVTNQVPKYFGLSSEPQVSTNSYTMKLPDEYKKDFGVSHTGEVPNASLPKVSEKQEAPKGMIRVKSPEGKTGMIPAEQLNDALGQGYQQIQ